jgi:hypothetical protein
MTYRISKRIAVFILTIAAIILAFQNCAKVAFNGSEDLTVDVVTSASSSSCDFNGTLVPGGESIRAFKRPLAFLKEGETCELEMRECQSGKLSGYFSYSQCIEEDKYSPCSIASKPTNKEESINCNTLGATYSGTFVKSTAYICDGVNWTLGNSSVDNSSSCGRQCPGSQPATTNVSKSCTAKLGNSYTGSYTETTNYTCSNSSWAWTSVVTDNSLSQCIATCNPSTKSADKVELISCSTLGDTYTGFYTRTTPYVCQGSSWVLSSSPANNTNECQRKCPGSQPNSVNTNKLCSDKLGGKYSGNYIETTSYSCATSNWSWVPSVSDNSSSCQLTPPTCGRNKDFGSWAVFNGTSSAGWCGTGSVSQMQGDGTLGNEFRWKCVNDSLQTTCQAPLCRSIALSAGHMPLEQPPAGATMLSTDNISGFTTYLKNSAGNSVMIRLGCSLDVDCTDPVDQGNANAIKSASNYPDFINAFRGSISSRNWSPYLSANPGKDFVWSFESIRMTGTEVVLTLNQTTELGNVYFLPDPRNGWFISGATTGGSQSTRVECR